MTPKLIQIYAKTFYDDEYVAELSLANSTIIIGYVSENGMLHLDLDFIDSKILQEISLCLDWVKSISQSLKK